MPENKQPYTPPEAKQLLIAEIHEMNIIDLLHKLSMASYKTDVSERLQRHFRLSLEAIYLDTLLNQ